MDHTKCLQERVDGAPETISNEEVIDEFKVIVLGKLVENENGIASLLKNLVSGTGYF